ncbi:anti-sigma-D factor RsdA [Gordonia sp. (in: high G+C Gram-positive bacteria)]|uniref:anti-sigma-D factor RsdA n=1 Tax=Gordonia sp. (in: high G+C Gram-positive bacteria) TaxID=84139 RepID=UPI003C71BBAA
MTEDNMSSDDMSSGPIDVSAVRRDDAFIDDLAAGRAAIINDETEYQLAGLIAGWRADTLATPMPTAPTINAVEEAIVRVNERESRGGLSRRLRIISGAAAILAIAGAGLLVLSEGSQPGDPLWNVKQVVFSEQAQQTQARMDAQGNINEARKALAAGDTVKAKKLIAKAEDDLGPIRDKDEVNQLREMIDEIKQQDPGALIPSLPALPSTSSVPTVTDTTVPEEPTTDPTTPSETSTPPSTQSSTKTPTPTKSETPKPSSSTPASSLVTSTSPAE